MNNRLSTDKAALRRAADLLRDGSARAAGNGTGLESTLREAARFVDRLAAGATIAEAVNTTPRVAVVAEGDAVHMQPSAGLPRWPHGSSEAYPSQAAAYGVEGLMAMAGSLAERDEWDRSALAAEQAEGTSAVGHLREAQRLAAVVEDAQGAHMSVADAIALAQVHATAALAAATLTSATGSALVYAVLAMAQATRDLPEAAVDAAEADRG